MKAQFLAIPAFIGLMGMGAAVVGGMGCTGSSSSSSSSSSSGGGGGGCADNGTLAKAITFALGATVDGKACYTTTNSPGETSPYYYWKMTSTTPWLPADRFTVLSHTKGSPEAGNTARLLLGSEGTYSQADWASDTLSSVTTTSTTTDISPVDTVSDGGTGGVTTLYVLAYGSLYADKSIEFDFKVTKQ